MTDSQSNLVGDIPNALSQVVHRRLIGFLGLSLPFLLYVVAGLRPTEGLPHNWALLTSVSAYYYTGAVGIFVGVLFALSLFLFTYPGYERVIADRLVGWLGGAGALGVALFPTAAPDGLSEPLWWNPWLRVVHYVSAGLLFFAFILFAIWLFRKSSVPKKENRPSEKQRRDTVCFACGITMIGGVAWTASSFFTHATSIFWPEAITIVAFGFSWLVKGRAYRPLLRVIRRPSANAASK